MPRVRSLLLLALIVAVAGCAPRDDRQWMKLGPYTSAEFDHDVQACTHDGDFDAACMEARGWVMVRPSRAETPEKKPSTYHLPGQ